MANETDNALKQLNERVHAELARTAHPSNDWVLPQTHPEGQHIYDVVIVGAGQGGLTVAHGLQRQRVNNLLVIDRAQTGSEGVWVQYARMPTLRSPKEFTGPDLGLPSLTYQSWHEANFGAQSWLDLDRIPTDLWHDYLQWFRQILDIPVRNQTALTDIATTDQGLLSLSVNEQGQVRTLLTRKLVLATGQDGTGKWLVPKPFEFLPQSHCVTAASAIDFDKLHGKDVIVIGQGASASDNAACALEAGANSVKMLVRRPQLQRVQPYLWMTFAGFLRHMGDMPDAWRWRFMNHVVSLRESIPQPTYNRMRSHAKFSIHLGAGVDSASFNNDRITLQTKAGDFTADFVILGTGIEIDLSARPELKSIAAAVATWADRYQAPANEQNPHLAKFPYHGADASLQERHPGQAPFLHHIYDFTIGTTLSFGPFGCSINAMNIAVPRIVAGITRSLFEQDLEQHWASLQAYDEKVFQPAPQDMPVLNEGAD